MQDTIERLITVNAPIERVFKAITDPAELVAWFPDGVEGEVAAGTRPIFDFGEYGKSQIYIVAKDEPSYFAYRWVPGASTVDQPGASDVLAVPNTLVEFRLEPSGTGTAVRLIESGFAALPAEMRESSLKENSGGWDYMLDRLGKLFSK
jgi:uncharacterized protein YndB with AHSA1/START domain